MKNLKNLKIKNRRVSKGEQNHPSQKQELSIRERTTRLVLVLTVLGGGFGFFGKYYFSVFQNSFESFIYLHMSIRMNHVLLICIGAYVLINIWYILCYIVAEFRSLNVIKNQSIINQEQFKIANTKYQNILNSIVTNFFIGSIIIIVFGIIQSFYFKDKLMISFIVIMLLIIIFGFVMIVKNLGFKNMNESSKVKLLLKKIPFKKMIIFILVSLLWLLLGIKLMIPPTVVNINFKNAELTINSTVDTPKNVVITFIHEQDEKEQVVKTIFLKDKDFKIAYQQTLTSPNDDNDFMVKLRGLEPNINESLDMKNSIEDFKYKMDYKKYIKNGQNYIIVSFTTKSFENKVSKIVNPIFYENGTFDIQESQFVVK